MNAVLRGLVAAGGALTLGVAAPNVASATAPPAKNPPTVTVNNTRGVPVVVYLERGDLDTRLGTVAPDTKTSLGLPRYVDRQDEVRVVVQPKGGIDLASQDISVPRVGTLNVLVPKNDDGYIAPVVDRIPNPGVGTTTVTVENPRDDAVIVYVEHGAFDTKVGTVPGGGIRTLDIPAWLTRDAQDVTFELHPRKGLDLATQQFTLRRGAHLEVKVPIE